MKAQTPCTSSASSSSLQPPSSSSSAAASPMLLKLPWDVQVNLLTYLRAYDLSAVQQTCRFYSSRRLADSIVRHAAERVYTPDLTDGFDTQPVLCSSGSNNNTNKNSSGKDNDDGEEEVRSTSNYTFEHLRNMELVVIARVLSRPEPTSGTGFVVSKSWCKAALRWLEMREQTVAEQQKQQQQQLKQQQKNKKKNKKESRKQRVRNRRLSDANPPWPNVNSDLLCEHSNLQYCLSKKSARARRRLLDKQSWKMLKKLYPDSKELEAGLGECLQCSNAVETERMEAQDRVEQQKLQRKQPLKDPAIRQFYTRTRGVPVQALRNHPQNNTTNSVAGSSEEVDQDAKLPVASATLCPLQDGMYDVIPRAWCHGWRRFIKTGEGGTTVPTACVGVSSPVAAGHSPACCSSSVRTTSWPPPDAAGLLCDAHRLPLLPPHLEAYLYGQSSQLWPSSSRTNSTSNSNAGAPDGPNPPAVAASVPGQGPDPASVNALRAAGLSEAEVRRQLSAMRVAEYQAAALRPPAANSNTESQSSASKNEVLDRENHSVVEILTQDEFSALEKCWPGASVFCLRFQVCTAAPGSAGGDNNNMGPGIHFNTPPCRECDPTGRRDSCSLSIKNRARGWVKKSAEKARAPASLEY